MKNIEVRPLASDALAAWKADRCTKLPFSAWLEAETPPSTLHEAALAAIDAAASGVRDKIVEAAQDLRRAIDADTRRGRRRCVHFESPSDVMKAHKAWCRERSCGACPYNQSNNPSQPSRARRKTMTNMQIYDKTKDAVDAWLRAGGRSFDAWLQEEAGPADELLYTARRVARRFTRDDIHLEPGLRDLVMRLDAAVARLSTPETGHGA